MSSIIGNKIKISVFGESHGPAIGVVIDGLPAGHKIDMDFINEEMQRRAPGKNKLSTARKEADKPKILSGVFNEMTTGAPLCAIVENSDTKSKDYSELKIKPRPSHADYPAGIRYDGFNDYRGGGHFSGRLTAMLVFAGAVCKGILKEKDIFIGSHIKSIADVNDKTFDKTDISLEIVEELRKKEFPVIDEDMGSKMQDVILNARSQGDSVGGIIECAAVNVPVGIGDPMFDSVESTLSRLLFSVPAVKGVEFGEGFNITKMNGSSANDEYYMDNGKVKTHTNNNGGILGGITTGMPIVFSTAIKPTPSIAKNQRTVNLNNCSDDELTITGRHDPCIVQRAVPVIEAVAAIGILDMMID